MNFFSGLVSSEPLMKWREPNAYVRKGLSHGKWIGLLIVLMIVPLFLIGEQISHHSSKDLTVLISFFVIVGVLGYIRVLFGSGSVVCLKEDHISILIGRSANRTLYKDIECCDVRHDSYNDTKFTILNFAIKKQRKFLPVGQVAKVAVPNDVNLEQVLQIIRDKGIKIIEENSI
jgi:hypothetical protein